MSPAPEPVPQDWTRRNSVAGADVDAEALASDLRQAVDGEVRFDAGSRALYSMDSSNYRQVPIGLVVPRSVEALAETVRICSRHGAPIVHRGGGTALAGQTTNHAVVIDSSKYCTAILDVDPQARTAIVEPGVVLDRLQEAAAPHGLVFGPDPSTHGQCTIGGMIGNNSAGVHSVTAGVTSDNVEELEILTYDGLRLTVGPTSPEELERIIAEGGRRGEMYRRSRDLRDHYADEIRARYPHIPRRVSGYNLDQLLPENGFNLARALVGSESTCVTVLRAKLRLITDPPCKVLLALGFDDVCHAADFVPRALECRPIGLEGIDHRLVANMRKLCLHAADLHLLPEGDGWLVAQFAADSTEEAASQAERCIEAAKQSGHYQDHRLLKEKAKRQRLWEIREAGLPATTWVPGQERDTWEGWEDSAVAPADLGNYIRELYALYDKYDYHGAIYGHFGDGLVHTRIDFGLHTKEDVERFRRFMADASELVTRFNGSLSGEHGDGQSRAELLPIMFGEEIVQAFAQFKAIWDPDNRMNPGKIVHPRPLDADLRFGPRYRPPPLETHFSYAEQGGSFSRAALRCVGVGKCRQMRGGTMCPSYRATREEEHTTRGRARMLQEMLQGDPVKELWKSEPVFDALHLCLSCKGCKGDCPVDVDMATYKAEFLSHYYEGRMRPRAAYALGLIHVWARMARPVGPFANLFTQTAGLGWLSKRFAGIAPERELPTFAKPTFRQTFARNGAKPDGRPEVLLWTDTFNNHFSPKPLHAAAAVLDAAGYRVTIADDDLCCGRPLYDFGMLDRAKARLRKTMAGLKDALDREIPIIGLEPSCMAVFKDELVNLFPEDEAARRLSRQAVLFDEFLDQAGFEAPQLSGSAIVHGHCHRKALWGMNAQGAVLDRTGLDFEILDNGCCGMAGAFGYEVDKYEVSQKVAEHELLPHIRRTPDDTMIIADGFSCRSQIADFAGRAAVTLPEALARGLPDGRG